MPVSEPPPAALYIHWPFCLAKCPYCDFNSHVAERIEHERWLAAYKREFDTLAERLGPRRITSVFFGGGTPSLMKPETAAGILQHVSSQWPFDGNVEITLEANPTSIEAEKFTAFREAGINRVSVGIQALNDADLKFLGRQHSAGEALKALETAHCIFVNVSFDLIYARPGQTAEQWEEELKQALTYADGHLSLYQLTIEKGTPFHGQHRQGVFSIPGEENAAALYESTDAIMAAAGLPAYAISNYAAPGRECRHNLVYWNYAEYLGIGPGAHGRVIDPAIREPHRVALMMTHQPERWLEQVENRGHGLQSESRITNRELTEECVMMGLRLTRGLDREAFRQATGQVLEEVVDGRNLALLEREGLLERSGPSLRATRRGRLVLNSLTRQLLVG